MVIGSLRRLYKVPCSFEQGTFFMGVAFLFNLWMSVGSLRAQDHVKLQEEAKKYYETDDPENALITARAALELAELTVGKNHIDYAVLLAEVGFYGCLNGLFKEGLAQNQEGLELIRKLKTEQSREFAEALHTNAMIYYFGGDYVQAEQVLIKAVPLYRKQFGENHKDYAIVINSLGLVQMQVLQKYNEAEKNFLQTCTILERIHEVQGEEYSTIFTNLGSVRQSMKDFIQAEKHYKQALRLDKKYGREKTLSYAYSLQNLGTLYMDMGRMEEAEAIIRREMQLKKELTGEESLDYAMALNNYGYLCDKLGRLNDAESSYRKSLDIKEKQLGKDHPEYGRPLSNLAVLYQNMGRVEEAYTLMQQALNMARKNKIADPLNYAFYACNFASLCSSEGKYDESEKYYKEALDIYKEHQGPTYGDYSQTLSDLAVVYAYKDEVKRSRELLTEAMDLATKARQVDERDNIHMLNNLACAYQQERNFPRAVQIMKEAVQKARSYYGEKNPAFAIYLFNLGLFQDEGQMDDDAERSYDELIELDFYNLENNFRNMSESEKGSFYLTMILHFDVYYREAIQRTKNHPQVLAKMLNYRIATKSLLLSGASKMRKSILESKDSTMVRLYIDWKSQKDYLLKLYSLPKRELALQRINVDSLEKAVNLTEKKLSQSTTLFNQHVDRSVTWKSVQALLQPDEAAVEMIRVHSPYANEKDKVFYIALIVDKHCEEYPRVVILENGYEMEREYTRQYRQAIFDTSKKENTYKYFWEKIDQELKGKKRVYFSGDGVYAKINLNSIRDHATSSWLLDRYEIRLLSSLRDLKDSRLKPAAEPEKTAALFGFPDYTLKFADTTKTPAELQAEQLLQRSQYGGARSFDLDPLPGTKKEVTEIWKLLKGKGWKVSTYMAESATEKKIKQLNSPVLLHIATHGYFQNDIDEAYTPATSLLAEKMARNPLLRSGLMMAGASHAYNVNYGNLTNWSDREDGILTAYEAMNLNLDRTEIVVLSACETGLGEIRNGEGVYGLQRAFLAAGARSVIMSLWPVSDAATQQLMTLFYSKWVETGDKHAAFRFAQMELRKTFPDPYYWSAFVLIGQ